MTTTVELERAGTFEAIQYGTFEIQNGTSDGRLAPEARITTANSVPVESNQRVRIVIDGVTRFMGRTTSEGTRRGNGQRVVKCEHEAYRVFDEAVSVGPSSDAATVLSNAIGETSFGSFTVDYTGTSDILAEDYEVENRKVKQIFRDITDRVNRVFWVATDGTITVQPRGGRGEWTSVSLPGDRASIDEYEAGDVRSVINDVTVVGTREEKVEGSAVDSASISEYGRRSERYNLAYVTTTAEANDAAEQLLQPEPLDSAKLTVGSNVGTDPEQNLANYTITLTDPSLDLSSDTFLIESQTIEQGRVTLEVGEASRNSARSVNRKAKSNDDVFEGDDLQKVQGDLDDVDDGANFGRILQSAISSGVHTLEAAVGDLDNIDDGGTFARVNSGNVDSDNFVLLATSRGDLDDIDDGNDFGKVKTTAIDAGEIILAETIGDLDDIDDGSSFGKVSITNLTPGGAVFANGVELNDGRDLDDITQDDANKGNATVIDGGEILTGSIQANEIDALVLDTDQIKVGFDTDTEIEFVENTLGDTAMRPEFDDRGYIGDPSHRFDVGFFNVLDSTAVGTDDLTINSGGSNIVTAFADSGASLRPSVDNEGALGTNTAAWATVTAHNIFEQTPEPMDPDDPIDGVDLDELKASSWDKPPAYVAQRKATAADDREYIRQNPKTSGVELGHMTNYLLETCKAQQETIDDLESRIEQLEAAVGPNA